MGNVLQTKDFKRMAGNTAFVRIYADQTPETFPKTTDDVDDEPDGFNFAVGSSLVVVDTGERFMVKSDGTWKSQGKAGGSSSGSGGSGNNDSDSTVDQSDIATDDEVNDYIEGLDIFN